MTDRALASETTEPLGDAAETARLMGLPSWRKMSSLSLVDQIERDCPFRPPNGSRKSWPRATLARSTR